MNRNNWAQILQEDNMHRNEWAKVLQSVRRRAPVSRDGVAAQWSIDRDKWTVDGHIARNKEIRINARRKGFA